MDENYVKESLSMSDMRLGIIFIFVVIEMLMIRVVKNKGSQGYRSKGR